MAATPASSIPRFLLPQYGSMWRRARPSAALQRRGGSRRLTARHASSTTSTAAASASGRGRQQSQQPVVLEKPAKFNPPSHGSRLPRKNAAPRHYGGDLSQAEAQAQGSREYPGMMAPEGTAAHWFWHSRRFHMLITISALSGLAGFTFVENFRRTSPFADMLPSGSDFASRPFTSLRTLVEAVRLTEAQRSAEVAEKRKRRVDDVVKRSEYRKAHGLDKQEGLGGWTAKTDAEALGPAVPVGDGSELGGSVEGQGRRKKFLGIF